LARPVTRAKSNAQEAQASQALAAAIPFLAQFAVYPVTEPALDHFDRLVKLKLNVGKMDLKGRSRGARNGGDCRDQ
jgi:hypothetical protein